MTENPYAVPSDRAVIFPTIDKTPLILNCNTVVLGSVGDIEEDGGNPGTGVA